MAEWLTNHEEQLRIQLALVPGERAEIPWRSSATDWISQNLDAAAYPLGRLLELMYDHVKRGRRIKVKDEVDPTYGAQRWYGMTLACDGIEVFVKFKFRPNSESRIIILNAHD
jgi:hypothetical protein